MLNAEKLQVCFHKFLREKGVTTEMPANVRVYLCGMIDRVYHPDKYSIKPSGYVIRPEAIFAVKEGLVYDEKSADTYYDLGQVWLQGYYTFRFTGEFNVIQPIFEKRQSEDLGFPKKCYGHAGEYARKLQRFEESSIFRDLSGSLDDYFQVLERYVGFLNAGDVKLTTADYEAFKEDVLLTVDRKPEYAVARAPDISDEGGPQFIL